MKKLWVVFILFAMGFVAPQAIFNAHPDASKAENNTGEQKWYLETPLAIRKAVVVPAPVDKVWEAWTTTEGVTTFFAPKASVELAVFGDFEMYFDPKQPKGQQGSEGCKILSFITGEMFSFTWNAPLSMPTVRQARTWVVLHFYPHESNHTRITLTHVGWKMGEEWQKALQYFNKTWEVVLGRLQYRFQKGPIDWKKPFTPGATK
ncbi:MAG: SRPBCC domain-containing protein [Candidatus Aminicenantes bacterium]|nr:SRPBCC domain-containing protein [Candidatus Aminicenantes bacterium]NIM77647.1 SRPBCC domain-containing protein [Candidatus Aminicenantes bacterium]NIN16959.1 SRPBCC domain-containing protein [Candidatus Aminicenantes bacterium]NIN40852.1 SRPBCC domain-containing protein [Candidatus Aminicenantes bacterium]NIN83656.1 SRPBCC domain-containing protein [Candidatus Aminicenantes bacterium]